MSRIIKKTNLISYLQWNQQVLLCPLKQKNSLQKSLKLTKSAKSKWKTAQMIPKAKMTMKIIKSIKTTLPQWEIPKGK